MLNVVILEARFVVERPKSLATGKSSYTVRTSDARAFFLRISSEKNTKNAPNVINPIGSECRKMRDNMIPLPKQLDHHSIVATTN